MMRKNERKVEHRTEGRLNGIEIKLQTEFYIYIYININKFKKIKVLSPPFAMIHGWISPARVNGPWLSRSAGSQPMLQALTSHTR